MYYKEEKIKVEELLMLYIDILYEDIKSGGVYPVEELDINKPGVPYPIAKSLLDFLERAEEYEKCQIVNDIIKDYKLSRKKKANGKSNVDKI